MKMRRASNVTVEERNGAAAGTASSLRCRLVTDFADLERLAGEWERLFHATSPPGGIFQSWAWTRAFWRAHGAERSLCTPVLFRGDRVAAILPVAVHDHTARLIGTPYTDYNGVLCEPELAGEAVPRLIASLLTAGAPWRDCVWEGVPDTSPLVTQDGARVPPWLRARWQVAFAHSSAAAVNDGTLFEQLSRKESLRRHENRLARRGPIVFRHIEDRDEILTHHLDRFVRMRITRQALSGVRSRLLAPEARAMLRAIVTELDPASELRFSVLEVDRTPVAYHLGLEHAGTYTWYMPTFDVDLWNDGPGEVLLRHLLKYAHQRQLREFDFTIGDEGYKDRFANVVRQTFTVHVAREPYRPAVQVRRVARAVGNTVRRRPVLLQRARHLRAALRRLSLLPRRVAAIRRVWTGATSRPQPGVVECNPVHAAATPHGVHVSALALSRLALLRLEYRSLDDATVQAMRRRMNRETAYLVSVGGANHVFWVNVDEAARERRPVDIVEGPGFGRTSRRSYAAALAALLCALHPEGRVRVTGADRRAAEAASRQAGYLPHTSAGTGPLIAGCWTLLVVSLATAPAIRPVPAVQAPFPASGQRPYTDDSPWNTPIPSDAAADPSSATMIAAIAANGPLRSDPTQFTFPLFFADAATPRVTLTCSGIVATNNADGTRSVGTGQVTVPLPAGAAAAAGTDAQLIVVDASTGDEYDIWQFTPPASCVNVTRYVRGVYRNAAEPFYASRGGGMPYLAGLIRPWEIAQGRIDHALAFGHPAIRRDRCVYPASKTDGTSASAGAIPEGARIQLDPSLDVSAIPGLSPAGQAIARALQVYGAYVVDVSGSNKIYAESSMTAGWDAAAAAPALAALLAPAGKRVVPPHAIATGARAVPRTQDAIGPGTVSAIPVDRLRVLALPAAYWSATYAPTHGACVR